MRRFCFPGPARAPTVFGMVESDGSPEAIASPDTLEEAARQLLAILDAAPGPDELREAHGNAYAGRERMRRAEVEAEAQRLLDEAAALRQAAKP